MLLKTPSKTSNFSLLSSSGVRNSVVNSLKLRDLEKIEKYNLYKITAYRKSKKYQYQTFCTTRSNKFNRLLP